jgi:CheY-like chemotaxis protein
LRTPLTPVLMTVAALEADRALPASARPGLQMLRRNIELEARLIDDLLDITRIAHGKVELQLQEIDIHSIIDAALEIARGDIESKQLSVVRDLRATDSRVTVDPVRIQQVLWNLIRNAAKFTPVRGRITVRTDDHATGLAGDDMDSIRVSITDTGIGIDGDAIGKIFTPFEQADRAVTRQFGGLGLGLTISKRLTELHGGTITANSEGRGTGATFTLVLPTVVRRSRAANGASASDASLRSADGDDQRRRRLNILLVEDHEDTRTSMTRLIARSHDVQCVGTMAAALVAAERSARKQPFDLVISDLGLPDGSGLDLMRTLHEQYGLCGICLTGFGSDGDIAQSADAGFRQHLTKPVDLRALELAIDHAAREVSRK